MIPRHPLRGFHASACQLCPQGLVAENARDRIHERAPGERDDERLAIAEEAGDAAPIGDDDRSADRRRLGGDHAEALTGGWQDENVCGAIEVERRRVRRREHVHAVDAVQQCGRSVSVVGADHDYVYIVELACSRCQMLEPFAGGDPTDVEHERRIGWNPDFAPDVVAAGCRRLRKSVAADAHVSRGDTAGDDVVALTVRNGDDRRCARPDPAIERRIEQALQPQLPHARGEHAKRLEHVRDAARATPRGRPGRHRIAETEDVHDVRPLEP